MASAFVGYVAASIGVSAAFEAAELRVVSSELSVDASDACRGTAVVVTEAVAYVAASGDVSAAFEAAELSVVSSELSVDACNGRRGTAVSITEVEVCVCIFGGVCAAVSSVIEFAMLPLRLDAVSPA